MDVCRDGFITGMEECDDGNMDPNDGCSALCTFEPGFTCGGEPTVCTPDCGDGVPVGTEECDDMHNGPGDGCTDACTIEVGWDCPMGLNCAPVCGDNMTVGMEVCDSTDPASGCLADCTLASGEDCGQPLGTLQATASGGGYLWAVPADGVTGPEAVMACDPNTHGPDVVVRYVKTTGTLAQGGQLLHAAAAAASASTANYLNVEVTAAECGTPTPSLKCLWYKQNWDLWLDVPQGEYFVWVGKNSPGTMPAVVVQVEEAPPSVAEGEGCFAPFTVASTNHTPPATPSDPHVWVLPATINSFDMGPAWGEPGSISCDNTASYGDIHGVDAVIEYSKTFSTSVLHVVVQNLDQTNSDLNAEVLNVCEPTDPSKVSSRCEANKDLIDFTTRGPTGPGYIWVSTEATGEEFGGATVSVTEIFPGLGESLATAEPLAGSGPISPTSTMRLDAPSCFPAGVNVHWYSHTMAGTSLSVSYAGTGPRALVDGSGVELGCAANGSNAPLGTSAAAGTTVYLAVQSPDPGAAFTLVDFAYTGVKGPAVAVPVVFPSSATADYGMAADSSTVYLGGISKVFAMPRAGGTAVELGTAEGLTAATLGYDLVAAAGNVFSVDSTTSTTASRLYAIKDAADTWGPVAWDLAPSYAASSPTYSLATDDTTVFMATRHTSADVMLYSVPVSGPAVPTLLGTNTSIHYVVGLAVDGQFFYLAANGGGTEGVYRIPRAAPDTAATLLFPIDTSTLHNSLVVDAVTSAQHLYVRENGGDIHAMQDPGGATPLYVGVISTLGTTADYAMTYERGSGTLYFFETETDSAGVIRSMQ